MPPTPAVTAFSSPATSVVAPAADAAGAGVSAAARLAYVWRHFTLAYPGAPTVRVGPAESQPATPLQVEISDQSAGFFDGQLPYPPAPNWREWRGQRVPFFFDNSPEKSLLIFSENHAVISADIISAAFYLLSGWQEYFSAERDQHGRFPYAASVQKQYGFVALPVVNYYFDVLRAAVEHVSGQRLTPRRWGEQQAELAAFISHDVDNLHGGWGEAARAARQQTAPLALKQLGTLAWRWLRGRPAPWANLAAVRAATARYDAPATFFILPRARPAANGTPNADYDAQAPALASGWRALAARGAELAVHGSYDAATSAEILAADIDAVSPQKVVGNRFHYLRWEPTQTPQLVAAAGIQYDCTLGFAEHYGFRNACCLPFYPFDFQQNRAHEFLEIPLIVMDTTLHHPAYLRLDADELLSTLQPVFAEIKKFGGVVSVLWHNQNFSPANTRNGPAQFHALLTHLQQQGARFYTGAQLADEIKNG